ncbi:MAG: DUF4124 domain-containing protein [Ramlibacter sp.]|nr:DUF4124 domain-containing protein [Ramlibacter sp.]
MGVLLAGCLGPACAQEGIYTCINAKGQRITADRPIAECLDREQKELTSTGSVKRKIGPSLTAEERAAQEERLQKEAEERNRLAEEKKRDRALLARYPMRATHDRERANALKAVDEAMQSARKRIAELQDQRQKLQAETEFYKGDAAKTPARLKRQFEENEQHTAAQKRFIANQQEEVARVNDRFDHELAKLQGLWEQQRQLQSAAAAVRTPASRPGATP